MLNLHALSRPQQILLAVTVAVMGTLLVLALAQFSSQVIARVTPRGLLMDAALQGTPLDDF